jgi:hypothetical protein
MEFVMRCSVFRIILFSAMLLSNALILQEVNAEQSVFEPTDDNFILSDVISWSRHNWGIYPELAIGLHSKSQPYRALMRFDISSLGGSTSITSATVRLRVTRVNKLIQDHGNFELRLLLINDANAEWVEGTKLEHKATEGDSCWRFRKYDTSNWVGGPGIGKNPDSQGIDALLDTLTVDVTNTVVGDVYSFVIDSPEGINALTNWAAGGTNAGLLMTTDEGSVTNAMNAIYFGSKENTNPLNHPEITVHTADGDFSFGTSDDNLIWERSFIYHETRNWGVHDEIFVGMNDVNWFYRGLMRFDLEPMRAAYTTFENAELTLTVNSVDRINPQYGDFELRLFLLADANAGWDERSEYATEENGASCWQFLSHDDITWAGGGGIGNSTASAGISNLLASVVIDADTITNDHKIVMSLDSPVALSTVESWMNGGVNAGLLLVTDEASAGQNTLILCSSEHSDPTRRPELKINYTADVTTYEPSGDNFMYNGSVGFRDTNWGAWTTTQLAYGLNSTWATYRTLMRFDIAALDTAHKRIKAAKVTVTQANNSKIKPANGTSFETRLLLPVLDNADWIEGTGDTDTALPGESCWNWEKYNTDAWVGGGGIGISANSAGVAAQLATAQIDTATITVGDKINYYIESEEGLAILERWANGGVNEGFLLTTDEASGGQNALMVGSREHTDPSYRPVLTVVLEPVIPQGAVILLR